MFYGSRSLLTGISVVLTGESIGNTQKVVILRTFSII